ncbi:hypothetical protein CRG98_008847 [Punica granatum]|uniref:Uncharacterized protein n=1 Tax=Punica granatum TaxID=22663 RepID=A0A2I0KQI4_PUNGR|nr:hypothetical protein CRG98_008847 [Punica granatum]
MEEGVGVTNWQPRPRINRGPESKSPVNSGSEPPIGDPDPSAEGAGVLCGCRRPRWRVRGPN